MSEKKLFKITIENIVDEQKYVIEYLANKNMRFPDIAMPNLTGKQKMCLTYVLDGEEQPLEVYDNEKVNATLNQLIDDGVIGKIQTEYVIPKITYQDITEYLLLGSEKITKEYLYDKNRGIWSDYGNRRIEIEFSDVKCFTGKASARINLKRINGEDSTTQNFVSDYFDVNMQQNNVIIDLDTDLLGKAFSGELQNKQRLKFSGDIEVKCEIGNNRTTIYKYPIEIMVINTNPDVCDRDLISDTPASVDFGTSSTCVAIEGDEKTELLSLSSNDINLYDNNSHNIFENPTNIMIYRWKNLYEEWKQINDDMPLPKKGSKDDYLKKINGGIDFDFGYNVKEILGDEFTSRKELNAILSLIKMIPYQIIQEKQQIDFNPYEDKDLFVDVVANPEECDEKHFDPVAFYGYLIGKTVNDLTKHTKIFTDFQITSPVMFTDEIKNALKKSLMYGIKRSVPKNMRNKVNVIMEHTEPVAYIGALCGTQYFKIAENEKKFFAVYDFGGGTLDFSFGTALNEDDDVTLKILKVGGRENFGGEILIEKIAFKIYCDSTNEMLDNDIPIIKPYGEDNPDDIPESMFNRNDFAKANMNIISAKIARKIFETSDDNIESSYHIELYNKSGELTDCNLSVQFDDIEDELNNKIKDTVKSFGRELRQAFKEEDGFKEDEVYIFKAGNSSRSKYVEEEMNAEFPNNKNMQLVDQIQDNTEENKRYALTPKTAVAFGQLRLNNFEVQGDSDYFKYYLGFFNEGTGEFKICVDNSDKTGQWKKFRKIKNKDVDIFYSTYIPEEKEKARIQRLPISMPEHKGEVLWVKVRDNIIVDYCAGNYGSADEIPEDVVFESMVLK